MVFYRVFRAVYENNHLINIQKRVKIRLHPSDVYSLSVLARYYHFYIRALYTIMFHFKILSFH